jgi:predicted TIM-barrel fold metal-dependent hydrolase
MVVDDRPRTGDVLDPPISARGLVSADSHVNEPRDLWRKNLPAKVRDQAMAGIEATEDGGWRLIMDGPHVGKAGSSEAERLAPLDPAHRFGVMRAEGIVAECIFPTIGLYVWMLADPDGGKYSCRVYNDWIYDQLESQSPRFCCAGLIPTWQVDDAIDEVHYAAGLGLGAVMLPAVVEPFWNHRSWTPLWDAIAETGLPVVMHQGSGHNMIWYRGPGATVANLLATQSMGPRAAAMLATSGVLADRPDLHVVFVEFNAGWLPWLMETIDFYTESFGRYGTTDQMGSSRLLGKDRKARPVIYPTLDEPPSFYVRRQVHATFQDDRVALQNFNITGVRPILWGSDYPHEEGTYPNSRATVDRLAADLSEADALDVFRWNAATVFGFDREVLDTPV